MNEIIVYFEKAEDNYMATYSVSYVYGTTNAEILANLEHSFGKVNVLGYEII